MWLFDQQTVPSFKTPPPGPKAKSFLERDSKVVSPSYTRGYPLVVDRGSGCVIEDVDGNLYLDCTAGIAVTSTGHCHPEVVKAITDQAGKLIHMSGTDFYYEPQIMLAEKLAELAPGSSPKKVFFTNSGTESIEAALKLARHHTGRPNVIAFFGSFHGRTYGAMSLSASKLVHRKRFGPLVPHIHHVNYPRDCVTEADSLAYIKQIEQTVFKRTASPDEVAAIFVEPVQGEGGYYPAPTPFLQGLRKLCDQHGILMVADEIQCGMGRTGKLFALEHAGAEADITCLAKGIASGLPLGAIVAKTSVMNWPSGSHASTFGGNPIACRAALTTIDLLQKEYLLNTNARGDELRAGLRQLESKYTTTLKNVRGLGLMVAVDVMKDGQHSLELRNKIEDTCFEHGLLILGCGESGLRLCPPLCITPEQVKTALRIMDEVIGKVTK
ncbi:MAG TPA: acetyl ornithine aminotransferase family protein [Gemmatales bacterium]|nr:acetyl ornithine aminotransferase family protein [Gemmatales bacterium]